MNREDWGWNSFFQNNYIHRQRNGLIPARVIFQGREIYRIISEQGESWAEIAGALRREPPGSGNLPVCGDWALADDPTGRDRTTIRALLPRKTAFSRQQAGTAVGQQVAAANIDIVCLVCGLDSDFNPRRIERYLAVAWESGARPIIALNKADVCDDVPARIAEAAASAPGVPVFATSATNGNGIEDILSCAGRGQTLALLGSSGVGKSSLVNRLLGNCAQNVRETDSRGKGMHTTVARQIFLLPSGGLIMDTPGMREIQIWSADGGLDAAFEDIQALARECRFRNCSHHTEPGCRVRESIAQGELDNARFANYLKLRNEARYIELKKSHSANWVEKERWKKIAMGAKEVNKRSRSDY